MVEAPQSETLSVIAFLDPAVMGALDSLDRHADALSVVAPTGLLLGDRGSVVDRLDPAALDVARSHHLRTVAVIQNLDERGGPWRGDRVLGLARDAASRERLGERLAGLCAEHSLDGINLDFEELDDDDGGPRALVAVTAALSRALRPRGLELSVDVPASFDEAALARLGALADRVIVMAYDQNDEDGPPGPIASEPYVDGALASLAPVPKQKQVAGLGIYGYDWVGHEPADPVSFVDAQVAAKEARAEVRWDDASGSSFFHFSDEEGPHEVWLLDAASVWNQVGRALRRGVSQVALWRLGGEDPGVWEALRARREGRARPAIEDVPADDRVENQGDGPFLSLSLSPEAGRRRLELDGDRVAGERFERLPSPWLVRRAGIVPGKVALSFDDGPDPRFTPRILDVLHEARAPASFFVVGLSAGAAPDLVRRAFAEGHEIGNHTFTHPDVDEASTPRLRLELEATSRLVETLIGRRPLLYRPPSLKDIEPHSPEGAAAFARAGALGYLVVDADVDPRDWQSPSAADLARRVLDEAEGGGVILLHDGGGDRSATVEALPAIIAGLRARGLSIVPLAELVGKTRDQVMPPPPPRPVALAAADHAVFSGTGTMLSWASVVLWFALAAVALRSVLLIALALVAERRRASRRLRALFGPLPSATVVIPAYNEREVIARTVRSVLASDLPLRVIVVDDGSQDGTSQVVAAAFRDDPRVQLVWQPNAGKAAALRRGFAMARTEVVIALDGDTLFSPDTARRLVEPFTDRRVGAVAGTCEVGNERNLLTACQAVEYLVQQELERRAWDALSSLPVVPGAVGAWRRRAVAEVGGFSSATLAEDADLSMALCRAGWRVVQAPSARARTEAPETAAALVKQRVRWSFGILQAMWKHKRALVEARAGGFGRLVLPAMVLFQVLLPPCAPVAMIAAAAAAWAGNLGPALVATLALLACEALHVVCACMLARRSGGTDLARRRLPLALAARLFYRPLLFLVLLRSLGRVLDGIPLGWNKLARRGTVSA